MLGMQVEAMVLLPEQPPAGQPLATLYLLHGLSDDHTIWLRRTSLERYLGNMPLAVVLPNGHRSFYADLPHEGRYFSFMADELPQRMRAFFPLSERREDNFVAGLSMGGYGAFKLALQRPRQYAAAASFSGALDVVRRVHHAFPTLLDKVFGGADNIKEEPHNLLKSVARIGADKELLRDCPALYQACATEDVLYQDNLTFRDAALAAGLPLTYTEGPGGHEWGYWDACIKETLRWLPMENGGGNK